MPALIRRLYKVVGELEREFGRKFTPDGHLVGSIGEVLGAAHFGLELHTPSNRGHDARSRDGLEVEIKATQGRVVALRNEPDHLIVLSLAVNGSYKVIYNGPGAKPWREAGKPGSNGQRQISLAKLRQLMAGVPDDKQLPSV